MGLVINKAVRPLSERKRECRAEENEQEHQQDPEQHEAISTLHTVSSNRVDNESRGGRR
jgi:hypothetical protein